MCRGQNGPASHSEKTYDFSALYISIRNRGVDEFWNTGWRAFVTTTGTCRSAGRQAVSKPVGFWRVSLKNNADELMAQQLGPAALSALGSDLFDQGHALLCD